ncbi:MAG: DUF4338 domain-containing protein [Spirochaeta sp.]|nr:DUF4338 domain-containing protein [Spirochaeta sp.]
MMTGRDAQEIIQCGRRISSEEVEQIRETVVMFPGLSLKELVATICEHLGWYTAAGNLKREACLKLLRKFEAGGVVKLPQKQKNKVRMIQRYTRQIAVSPRTDPRLKITGTVKKLGRVWLEVVREKPGQELWNEYVFRYHGLSYKRPFGYWMRYFISCERGKLGCVLFSGAAKALGVRDRWIGWSDGQRLKNLAWVINNSRYLIFPWVQVKNLASHVLGQVARRVVDDWENCWGYRPVLMESFVDPKQYQGICYKAAGWKYLGMTTGEGLVRPGKSYSTTPKKLFVKPLTDQFREILCSENLKGWVEE